MTEMKRFDVAGCSGYCYGGYHMKEDVDGEYVTYESHVEAMKRIAGDGARQAEPVAWYDGNKFYGSEMAAALDRSCPVRPVYYAAPAPSASPATVTWAEPRALAESVAELRALEGSDDRGLTPSEGEAIGLVLRELARWQSTAASPAVLTDEAAMRVALRIMANLEDRNGLLDGVDDDTKADIADEIAVTIRAASPADQVEPYPIQYVLTDADHMVATFDALESALNERDAAVLEREESDGDDSPERLESAAESIADLTHSMRRAIHEYRKRAERYRASMSASKEGA